MTDETIKKDARTIRLEMKRRLANVYKGRINEMLNSSDFYVGHPDFRKNFGSLLEDLDVYSGILREIEEDEKQLQAKEKKERK